MWLQNRLDFPGSWVKPNDSSITASLQFNAKSHSYEASPIPLTQACYSATPGPNVFLFTINFLTAVPNGAFDINLWRPLPTPQNCHLFSKPTLHDLETLSYCPWIPPSSLRMLATQKVSTCTRTDFLLTYVTAWTANECFLFIISSSLWYSRQERHNGNKA